MRLDYATPLPRAKRTGVRFCLVAFGGGVAGLVAWCAIDLLFVRFAPPAVLGSVLLMFPVVVGIVANVALSHVEPGARLAMSVAATVLACGVAVVLVLVFGIPFHFWIGGKL